MATSTVTRPSVYYPVGHDRAGEVMSGFSAKWLRNCLDYLAQHDDPSSEASNLREQIPAKKRGRTAQDLSTDSVNLSKIQDLINSIGNVPRKYTSERSLILAGVKFNLGMSVSSKDFDALVRNGLLTTHRDVDSQ